MRKFATARSSVDQEATPNVARPRLDLDGGLTAREREVASLVAAGESNREIAEALVISEGTAEAHVKHILRKLGFKSRAQIAAWVTERAHRQP